MSLLKKVHHIAIICRNYETSKKFYTEILGFEIVREVYRKERNSYKLDLSLNGNYLIELFSFPETPTRLSQPEAAGLRHLAFEVESIDTSYSYFKEKGINVESIRLDEFTGKRFFFISDPDQLPIELYAQY